MLYQMTIAERLLPTAFSACCPGKSAFGQAGRAPPAYEVSTERRGIRPGSSSDELGSEACRPMVPGNAKNSPAQGPHPQGGEHRRGSRRDHAFSVQCCIEGTLKPARLDKAVGRESSARPNKESDRPQRETMTKAIQTTKPSLKRRFSCRRPDIANTKLSDRLLRRHRPRARY